jgi:hypothetical protein
MQLWCHINSYKLNVQSNLYKVEFQNKRQGFWWDAPELVLLKAMLVFLTI